MQRSRAFRVLASCFGLWFMFTLVQPNGMMGLTMGGGMTMDMRGAPMRMQTQAAGRTNTIGQMHAPMAEEMAAQMPLPAEMHGPMLAQHAAEGHLSPGTPAQPPTPPQCDQHDCCCSALSTVLVTPGATLAWLPEHVIDQDPPRRGDRVVDADGQVVLPFANGPPRAVSARA